MTGFGFSQKESESFSILLEVKSVNGRHLNILAKLPKHEGHLELEREITALLKERFSRGSFEIYLSFHKHDAEGVRLKLNAPLLAEYERSLEELRLHFSIDEPLSMSDLLSLDHLFITETVSFSYHEHIGMLKEMAQEAFDAVEAMRKQEGGALSRFLLERLTAFEELLLSLLKIRSENIAGAEERLKKRVFALLGDSRYDENRLLQEVTLLIDKSDIQEEIARLKAHIEHFKLFLNAAKSGKKMEFLLQEINREVNTIGSKSLDAAIAALVVEMKAIVEGMREQVLNIE